MHKIKIIVSGALLSFFLACPSYGAESMQTMRQIAQAGASLVIDLDRNRLSPSELIQLAKSLGPGSTLTIRIGQQRLETSHCLQIAKAKPGQVIFWF